MKLLCPLLKEEALKSWNKGSTMQMPEHPGHYWLFIQGWRLVKVFDAGGFLRVTFGRQHKKVNIICLDRWGKEFV